MSLPAVQRRPLALIAQDGPRCVLLGGSVARPSPRRRSRTRDPSQDGSLRSQSTQLASAVIRALLTSIVVVTTIATVTACAAPDAPGKARELRFVGGQWTWAAPAERTVADDVADAKLGAIADILDTELPAHAVRVEDALYAIPGVLTTDDVTVSSCAQLGDEIGVAVPETYAVFAMAHDHPRCAVRVYFELAPQSGRYGTLALDVVGDSAAPTGPFCGDGALDAGEDCDDGNNALFDGCDDHCFMEEFNGCETVIQNELDAAGLAHVDASTWGSPATHLMVHDAAPASARVDAELCNAAKHAADAACQRISFDMPFVGWCEASALLDEAAGACHLVLTTDFRERAPEHGVFSTALQGLLAFSLTSPTKK